MSDAHAKPVRHKTPPIRRDWLAKTLAGTVLGATLALGVSGLYSHLHAGLALPTRGQLAMWMVPPIWLGALSGVYFFSSGLRAWLWLGAGNALVYGALLALPQTG